MDTASIPTNIASLAEHYVPSTTSGKVVLASTVYFLYSLTHWLLLCVYRLTFHPLASFPGPFLCRISWLYQMYFEAIQGGKLLERLPELHRQYGPIVRLNPNEVHINDRNVYHDIYGPRTKFTKDPWAYSFGVPTATNMLLDPVEHRRRRDTLNPSFSKRRIMALESLMYEELERVFQQIKEHANADKVIPIQDAFFCYTGDVISRVVFGRCLNLIESPNFAKERIEQLRGFSDGIWMSIHFTLLRSVLVSLPEWAVKVLNETWVGVIHYCRGEAERALSQHHTGAKLDSPQDETIFSRLINASKTPGGTPGLQELTDEGVSLLGAGLETTATAITFATYYYLKHDYVQASIMKELESIPCTEDSRLPIVKIENLPYFCGFVKETLRFSHGVPGRLTRIVPIGGLVVQAAGKVVPAGATVGMSHSLIHNDPELFEDPKEFKPERWLGDKGKALDHWLLSFSKGSRDCIGKTLAYTEIHLILANLFRTFDLELCAGSDEAMAVTDRVIAKPAGSLYVWAKVKKRVA